MKHEEKVVIAVSAYFESWEVVRSMRSKVRSLRCEYFDQGDEYGGGEPKCHHDNTMLDKVDEWCEPCREGKVLMDQLKPLTKTMRLKLDVVRRIGRKLAARKLDGAL